ncbi:MAG: hypothetical protein KQI35_09135 [Bacteroidetes bacterium]|nr:hypothetical protein [Bacteroidota bacterium]
MEKITNPRIYCLFLLGLLFAACSHGPDYEVKEFTPLVGFDHSHGDTVEMETAMQNDIFKGILVPENGYFKMNFKVKNNGSKDRRFFYKIFYQNESYKFIEYTGGVDSVSYNPLASENFYGSWEDPGDSIHITPLIPADGAFHTIVDSFRIVGNPRNEPLYFGKSPENMRPTSDKIENVVKAIKNEKAWYESIIEKATSKKRSVEEQLYLDALWILSHERDKGNYNCRWKRNPRAGIYSFALVVVTPDKTETLPREVINHEIKQGDSIFINPYYSLLYDPHRDTTGYFFERSEQVLKTRFNFDLSSGIYIDPLKYTNPPIDSTDFDALCNFSDQNYRKAQVEQFFHNIDKNWVMNNVPLVEDYAKFTYEDYKQLEKNFPENKLRHDYISITDSPCETVAYSSEDEAIVLTNPPSQNDNMRKENVGIQSRIGFSYGKITAKIKFPEMLNDYNVWNGVTNAFWLIYDEEGDWNQRRPCETEGYIPKSEVGETDVRVRQTFYTEIDIEIVKASRHWPPSSYYNEIPFPENEPDNPRDIIVTCTNWDLACLDPENFNVGVFGVDQNGRTWLPHRWDHWYKALTMKYAVNHDSVFKRDFYYYQIDWQPERIIWRIGKDKEHMVEVGYLDTSVSSIPNNQMNFIVTQEYHHSAWWPTTEFKQEFIPYPAKPIVGKVYSIEIE